MITFPDKLELAVLPTPLQPLDRFSDLLGGPRIWVKRDDLTGCALTGNKVRKLEYTLHRALSQGADTLITCGGVQSNHCRATAILAARLGLKVHLVLRGEPEAQADGNLLLDQLVGAEISFYPAKQYQKELPDLLDHWQHYYESRGKKVYVIPTGASDGVGVWGYLNCARELKNQCQQHRINVSHIIHATGSGGTQAGLTLGSNLFELGATVIGMAVCDDTDYFKHKVRHDLLHWQQLYQSDSAIKALDIDDLDIQVNDNYIGPGYAMAGPEVFQTIKDAARLEGLIFDPVYSGKAFHGLISEIKQGALAGTSDIIFVHTGGIFGLLAQREAVNA